MKESPLAATNKSLNSWIWDAACSIRGAKDAPKYKDFIQPLVFTKRLYDVFDDELNRVHELLRFDVPNHGDVWKSLVRGRDGGRVRCEALLHKRARLE